MLRETKQTNNSSIYSPSICSRKQCTSWMHVLHILRQPSTRKYVPVIAGTASNILWCGWDINRVFNSWTEILIKHAFARHVTTMLQLLVGGRRTDMLWGIYVMNMLELWLHSLLIKRQVIWCRMQHQWQQQPQWRLNYYLRNILFLPTTSHIPHHFPRRPSRVNTTSHHTPRAWPATVLPSCSPGTTAECIQVGSQTTLIIITILINRTWCWWAIKHVRVY